MADAPNSFGQYKNFTNICGSAFQPYVANQIEKRKELISKEDRDPSTLQWLTNKSAWVRVSSGVDVDPNNERYQGLKGDKLSKKYILQSGLLNHPNKNTYELRSGIGPDGAYGIGGNDFGYRPMPGITGISINTGGKLGTLREATIDFICYNKEQLDIMDALYMKLGMSVLVEWGHIPYIDNSGKLELNPSPIEFYGIHTKEDLMQEIQSKRTEHSGNYDAMWGTIKNFSFTFSDNGSFKCQLQLVGAGDVLESLKINQSGKYVGSETGSIYPVVADSNRSYLNNALYYLWNDLEGVGSGDKKIGKDYFRLLEQYFNKLNIKFNIKTDEQGNPISSNFAANTPLVKSGFQFSVISKLNNITSEGGVIPEIDADKIFSGLSLPYKINGEDPAENPTNKNQKGLNQTYITLGNLLLLLMGTGNLFDQKQNNISPYIYTDVNPETNRCYTFPGHCSLDPTVCLIGSEKLPFGITSEIFDKRIKADFPFFDLNNPTMGRFMYTLVNINYAVSIISNISSNDPKGDVYYIDFIQELLKGISKACGGFNEFRVVVDDDTRCIRIFDDKRVVNPLTDEAKSPYTVIPVLGTKSLVYNFNYTSKIAPNTAAMIVISSQAEPTGINISNEALAFSKLRAGLSNRLSPVRIDSTSNSAPTTETVEERKKRLKEETEAAATNYRELRDLIKNIYGGVGGSLTESEIRSQQQQQAATQSTQNLRTAGVNDERVNADGTRTFTGPRI